MGKKSMGITVAGLAGFGFNTACAFIQHWSLQEFCWSTWLAALFFSWSCVAAAAIRIIFDFRFQKEAFELKIPPLKNVSGSIFIIVLCLAVLLAAWVTFRIYSYLFAFYGVFLSVWAEMEPRSFFGRNGFINSDFFSPVTYLTKKFWPMIVGLLVSNQDIFIKEASWKLMFLPFRSGAIVRIHILVLVMPVLCLLAWAISKNAYQPITITLLMGVVYLFRMRT